MKGREGWRRGGVMKGRDRGGEGVMKGRAGRRGEEKEEEGDVRKEKRERRMKEVGWWRGEE